MRNCSIQLKKSPSISNDLTFFKRIEWTTFPSEVLTYSAMCMYVHRQLNQELTDIFSIRIASASLHDINLGLI